MHILLGFVLIFVILAQNAVATADSQRVHDALTRLAAGDASGLAELQSTNVLGAACELIEQVHTLADDEQRRRVLLSASHLVRESRVGDTSRVAGDMDLVVRGFLRIAEEDSSESVRETAARELRGLADAETLDRYGAEVAQLAVKWGQREVLLLYGSLTWTNEANAREVLLTSAKKLGEDEYVCDWILARHGDEAAEARVLLQMEMTNQVPLAKLRQVVESLAYVRSRRVIDAMVDGLGSTAMIDLTGGAKIPKRNCCAYVLALIMRRDPGFPLRKLDFTYTDAEIAEVRGWSVKYRGSTPMAAKNGYLPVVPGGEIRAVPDAQ